MLEKPLDLRIQKTHKALIDAFRVLLEEKRFEDITVGELCDRAMVRRATFYKYFGDKYEFFTFMVQHIQGDYWKKYQEANHGLSGVEPYVEIMKNTLDFLDSNEALVRTVTESSAYPILLNIISEQIVLDVKQRFREEEKNGKELLLSADLMAQAYTGALINLARWWVRHKDDIPKEEVIRQITVLFNRLYYV